MNGTSDVDDKARADRWAGCTRAAIGVTGGVVMVIVGFARNDLTDLAIGCGFIAMSLTDLATGSTLRALSLAIAGLFIAGMGLVTPLGGWDLPIALPPLLTPPLAGVVAELVRGRVSAE